MSPARKIKGIVGDALQALRDQDGGIFSDPEMGFILEELIGRTPTTKSPATDAEILGVAYVMALDEFAPKIKTGPNRKTKRSKKYG